MKLRIDRLIGNKKLDINKKQTLGMLTVYENLRDIFQCKTLELPWKDNASNISCIPAGKYNCVKRFSKKYGWHFHVLGVKGRSFILIHQANFVRQLRGCIAVGKSHTDIDGDGLKDVTSSKDTMKKLLGILPEEFELEIFEL
jgi:hypothetical protein